MATVLNTIRYDVNAYLRQMLIYRFDDANYNFFNDFRENIDMILTPIEEYFYGQSYFTCVDQNARKVHLNNFTSTTNYLLYISNRVDKVKQVIIDHNNLYSDYLADTNIDIFYEALNNGLITKYNKHPYITPLITVYNEVTELIYYEQHIASLSTSDLTQYNELKHKIYDNSYDNPFNDLSLLLRVIVRIYNLILICDVVFNTFTLSPMCISISTLPSIINDFNKTCRE